MLKWLGLLVLGAAVFMAAHHYNKRFLDWLHFQSIGTRDYIVEKLSQMFIDVPPQKILLGLMLCSFLPGTLAFLALLPNVLPGILLGALLTVVGWKAPKPLIDFFYRRRVDKLVLQMMDGLSLMSNGLKSGLSVVQSMGLVVQEMPNPIQQEFNYVLSQTRLGVPLEEAFNGMARRVKSDDIEMFVTSVNILKETGGNLAETLDTIVNTIRERVKVEKKIEAMTAQGFYQGMALMAVPPVLAVILYQTDPEFMQPMFSTTLGWVILIIIMVLEVTAFFVIMKVTKIDV